MHKHALKDNTASGTRQRELHSLPYKRIVASLFLRSPVAIYLKLGVQNNIINMLLTLLWFPGIVHAACVLKLHKKAGKRQRKLPTNSGKPCSARCPDY